MSNETNTADLYKITIWFKSGNNTTLYVEKFEYRSTGNGLTEIHVMYGEKGLAYHKAKNTPTTLIDTICLSEIEFILAEDAQ